MNAYRDQWVEEAKGTLGLSDAALAVAMTLAKSVGIGRIAFTNWQHVNRSLSRPVRDIAVLDQVRELQQFGLLGRFQGNRYDQSRGWPLIIPAVEV